jgi:hypothetical protein
MTDQPIEPTESPDPSDLTDQVEQVEKSLADARDQLGLLFKFTNDHRQGLQRLSSQHGTTSRRVDDLTQVSATHGKQLARLDEALEQLKARGEILGEHMTDAQATAINEELTRLNGQAKAFTADLQKQIDTLKQRVDELQEQVDMQGPEISRAHDRIDGHDERITVIESGTDSTPRWALPVAVILGFIAALFWAGADFKQRLGDEAGSEFVYEFANGPVGMILFGIGVAAIAWFVFSFFGNQPRQQTATEQPADSTQRRESFAQRVRAGYQEGRARARRRPSDNDEPQPTRQLQEVNA